ncbi:MAG: hypothetical protein QNJ36_08990 [Calothrix sp. MO_167.B42]|nr:hypothetical protein [Calothrix sp. MO_167.B42]
MNSLPQSHIGFPEGQLITTDLSPQEITQISEAYRNKQPLPTTNDSKANRIIDRLKTTTYYKG